MAEKVTLKKADGTTIYPQTIVSNSEIDWSTVGGVGAGALLRVVEFQYSKSIVNGDNEFTTSSYASVVPSGYVPVGIVGLNATGSGFTRGRITRNILNGTPGDSTRTISMSFYTDYGGTNTLTFTWRILCVRAS